ncbi:RNA exonuclease 1-like protein, partial [Stegodyphus mimosarum]
MVTDSQENATYIPTPVDRCVKPAGILKTNSSNLDRPSTSFVPEYKPTPISKLKELNISQGVSKSDEYTPDYSSSLRKKKNIEEYDPTEVKCVLKKSVTFVDEQIESVAGAYVPPFSSDDDLDDSASAPKFSDDDIDEEIPQPPKKIDPIKKEIDVSEKTEETKIDKFSLVDKILDETKKTEQIINAFRKPVCPPKQTVVPKESKTALSKTALLKNKSVIPYLFEDTDEVEILSVKTAESKESSDSINLKTDPDTLVQNKSDHVSEGSVIKISESVECTTEKPKSKKQTDSLDRKSKKSESDKQKEKSKKHSVSSKSKKSSDSADKTKLAKNISDSKSKSSSNKKSSSGNKTHDSEKNKSSDTLSDKKHQSKSVSKSQKSEKVKLQDERVSSSSIVKKSKHGHNKKESTNMDTGSKSKDSDTKKRKFEDIDHESSRKHKSKIKNVPVSSTTVKKLKAEDCHNSVDEDMDTSVITVSSSESESDPNEECWRIYNENFPENADNSAGSDKEDSSKEADAKCEDLLIRRKQRFAHAAAASLKKTKEKLAVKPSINPAQVMHNRFAQIKALHARQNEQKSGNFNTLGGHPDKKRISVVPNPSLLAAVTQKQMQAKSNAVLGDFSPLPPTVSKNLKITKRVAHVPDVAVKPRPVIPADYGSKVPTNVRQKFLNAFIDEYLKFSTEEEAYESALEEEKRAYQRSSSKAIYMNVASNALTRLRHKPETVKKGNGVSSTTNRVSHQTVLNGPLAQRTSFSIERKKAQVIPELKGATLYEHLLPFVMTEEQLKENGYPLLHPTEAGRAVIEGIYANRIQYCNDPFKRTCCRCQKTYYVNVDGDYVRDEECDFHWGRLWKRRIAGAIESRYSCCQGDSESDGCCVSTGHVFEGSEAHVFKGYVRTLPKTPPPDKYYGIYSLDCEMCYTTAGLELTRVTVIGTDLKPVYETFVKPQNKVLDYNTRFSGITEDDLKNVRTTLRDVQAVMLCIFNDRTILIGHSLESDFKALKLIHKTVIDTSVVFPHKMGLPYKRALKTLMAEKLNKIIQNDVGGHDSNEDAVSCMELMLWKIKEELKG